MAANATFALKPGVWFLRVRFVIFAPDSRREPSPPSGRKSTQPTVQILEASSDPTVSYVLNSHSFWPLQDARHILFGLSARLRDGRLGGIVMRLVCLALLASSAL